LDPGTLETVLRCVEEAERKVDLGTYHRRATRAAVMIAEEGLPLTLGSMSDRDDAGRTVAERVAWPGTCSVRSSTSTVRTTR